MTEPLAEIVVEHPNDGSSTTATLIGEIDATNTAWLSKRLNELADPTNQLSIDLTRLVYIDSQGMRMIQALADRHHRGSLDLTIIAGPANFVWQLLVITGLDRVVPIRRPTDSTPGSSGTPTPTLNQ